jgi:hypothetical protein
MLRAVFVTLALAFAATACTPAKAPELRVLGIQQAKRQEVVFVQVTNPASHPMHLTKLEYTFASAGATLDSGEMPLAREVPAGSAVVVEVPLVAEAQGNLTLRGRLTAELDEIERIFSVSAQVKAQ